MGGSRRWLETAVERSVAVERTAVAELRSSVRLLFFDAAFREKEDVTPLALRVNRFKMLPRLYQRHSTDLPRFIIRNRLIV